MQNNMLRIYEDPDHTSENRLPQRPYYIPRGKSEYYLLNGNWNFAFFKRDIDVPDEIDAWDTISVPSCWQMLGYENPNYCNINYPYPCDPPFVPDANPCGVYERAFHLQQVWGMVYFVLEGVGYPESGVVCDLFPGNIEQSCVDFRLFRSLYGLAKAFFQHLLQFIFCLEAPFFNSSSYGHTVR